MRHETVTLAGSSSRVDWTGLGYLVSIIGVFLLGAVAWPSARDPWWHEPALIAGIAAAIIGMALRYKAHRDQQREILKARAEARSS